MLSNKKVNRLFLVIVLIFLAVKFLIGKLELVTLPDEMSLILSEAIILLPTLGYCLIKKISVKELIPFKRMKLSVWILVIVCTYLMYPLLIVLNAITLIFVKSGTVELMSMVGGSGFLVATLLMAVLPAFAEEFLFRGTLFGTYKRSKMLPAVFLSAFLFGCMHMNFNQFLYAFVLGIYLAFLVEATGSILSSMLAHFTINFTSVLVSFLLPMVQNSMAQVESATGMTGGTGLDSQTALQAGDFLNTLDGSALMLFVMGIAIWAVIAIGTTAGAVGVYIAISKISGRWEYVKGMFRRGTKERIITGSVIVAMVLMVAVIIRVAIVGNF